MQITERRFTFRAVVNHDDGETLILAESPAESPDDPRGIVEVVLPSNMRVVALEAEGDA